VLESLASGPAPAGGGVVVGNDFADDAAIVRLEGDDRRALVLTADVIAPLVDDPETFGEIAATNALSDVYAMGGRPLYALALAFFPDKELPLEVLAAILRGGQRACARQGVAVVGGHTVRDPELKYGLSVTGQVELDAVLSNQTAKAGQALVLTKALGTGIIGTAIKQGLATEAEAAAAITSMTTANDRAVAIARDHGVTACTDVTGFGLLGHLRNIVLGSGLCGRVDVQALPLLPGALEHARAGRVPGGSKANLAFLEPALRRTGTEDPILSLIAADAQTSGGLLLCVPLDRAEALVARLRAADLPAAAIGGLHAPDEASAAGTIELSF
jgi:selenide, water dikinase